MKVLYKLISALLALIMAGCSGEPEANTALVHGKITVADSVDTSNDYSGISVTIINRDTAESDADTLFHELTGESGTFSGTATFPERGSYRALVGRNERNISSINVILAQNDTLTIEGELPNFRSTATLQSREHEVIEKYQLLDRNLQRVLAFARAGMLKGDSLSTELEKWSNLFWEVYEENQGTIGSNLAASESVRLLQGWNNKEMMNKIRLVQDNEDLVGLGVTHGKDYLAESRGLNHALAYLDSLQVQTESEEVKMRISMEHIKLLYDSARVGQAKSQLAAFKSEYQDTEAKQWAEVISYDLNYLSPGDSIPSFTFIDNGTEFSRDSMLGTPYILEISTLANKLYQSQFDRTVVIHSLYKTYGLQVVTLPLDESQVTVDAFFEERLKPWPVAPAGTFDQKALLKRFNVRALPTRFLVDKNGYIIRKYVGEEYADIIQGIQTLTTKEEPAS